MEAGESRVWCCMNIGMPEKAGHSAMQAVMSPLGPESVEEDERELEPRET